jgi:predicted transcriptional regulator YdeE
VSIVRSELITEEEGNIMSNQTESSLELKDIYYLEPRLVEKGEIMVVGVGELFAMTSSGPVGINTKRTIPELYGYFQQRIYMKNDVKNIVDVNVNIGIEARHAWPPPIQYPTLLYQMACSEVSDLCDVPEDLKAVVIPASKYAVVSCESPLNPQTKQPLRSVDFAPLLFRSPSWRDSSGRIIINGEIAKEKDYALKMIYFWPERVPGIQENDGFPLYKYEFWTAIE